MRDFEVSTTPLHRGLSDANPASNWKWPEIPGLHDFQGDLVHSANWPEKFDDTGKTVALIGNGSSGVQILPEIQKSKRHLRMVR